MPLRSTNPATGELVQEFPELTDSELETKLATAQTAFDGWKQTSFEDRSSMMHGMAVYLREHAAELGNLMTLEMGKTTAAAIAEIQKCAAVSDFYADQAPLFLANEPLALGVSESYVEFDPLGIILAVMPWNFPFWQVYRFAAPALMAGNVGVLKHASNVPQCAQAIEDAFSACGFPAGAFQNLVISSSRVEKVIRDPRIVAVTLTGSEHAGSMVAKVAGEALKKCVLELGGSDPFIVLDDANISEACAAAVTARLQNNVGQSCIAAKRFILQRPIAESFIEGMRSAFIALQIGNPSDPAVNFGPLATEQMLKDIENQVQKSVACGAVVLTGGKRHGDKGYFYEPTILTNVSKGMPAYDEEIFGPVAAIIVVDSEDEALRIANDTPYGLGATIFTQDLNRAKRLAPHIQAGAVFINGPVKSDPRAPFGGIKKSGYGRELAQYGIKEFVNIKTISIK